MLKSLRTVHGCVGTWEESPTFEAQFSKPGTDLARRTEHDLKASTRTSARVRTFAATTMFSRLAMIYENRHGPRIDLAAGLLAFMA